MNGRLELSQRDEAVSVGVSECEVSFSFGEDLVVGGKALGFDAIHEGLKFGGRCLDEVRLVLEQGLEGVSWGNGCCNDSLEEAHWVLLCHNFLVDKE